MTQPINTLEREDGQTLGYRCRSGDGPGLVWLSGFNATMGGNKARALDDWAVRQGRALVRFDYFGTGASSGDRAAATIGRWRADTLAVLDALTEGPQILVGSSLGGWLALLAALARPERVKALVLLAPAADLTETLMWDMLPLHVREALEREGRWKMPTSQGDTMLITRAMIEEGRNWLLLDRPVPVTAPVRILQGWRDRDVPWSHALRLVEQLEGEDVRLDLIKSADHRLSEPGDIERLFALIEEVS